MSGWSRRAVRDLVLTATRRSLRLGERSYVRHMGLPTVLHADADWEPWLEPVYRAALSGQKPGAFIDVGANVGQTLLKVLAIAPECRYVGFEPQANAACFIELFITANRLDRCHVLPVGLSDTPGVMKLLVRGDRYGALSSGSATVVSGFRPDEFYTSSRYIVTVRGDDVLPSLDLQQGVSTIKIDVEGGELEVLRGFEKTLAEHRPFVLFEVLPGTLIATGERLSDEQTRFRADRTKQIDQLLRSHDYRVFHIQGQERIVEIPVIELQETALHTHIDYVAVHANDAVAFVGALRAAGAKL